MTWEHIAVLVSAVALVGVAAELVSRWQIRRVMAQFDAQTVEPVPVSWSDSVGWDPAEVLHTIRRQVAAESWQERMVADLPPILAELVTRRPVLAIEPAPTRELTEVAS